MSNARNFWCGTEKQFTVVLMLLPVNAFERKYIWSCGLKKDTLDEKIFTQQKSSYQTSVCQKNCVVKVKIPANNYTGLGR
jgi:transposase-like protein